MAEQSTPVSPGEPTRPQPPGPDLMPAKDPPARPDLEPTELPMRASVRPAVLHFLLPAPPPTNVP